MTIARRQSLLAGPAGLAFLGSLARVDLQTLVRAAGIADEGVPYGIRPSVARTSRWFAKDRASETFAPRAPNPAHASAVTDLLYASVQRERRSVTQWLGESSPADVLAVLGHVVEDIAFGPQAGWRRLAGMPDSCWEPLSGLADLMTNSPSMAWWWETLGGEQRWLGRVGESPPGSHPAGGWSSATAALHENGTWWVEPVTDGTLRTTRAIPGSSLPVSVLCRDDHARIDGERADVWAADNQGGARIFEVRGPLDWVRLVTSHPRRLQHAGAEWFSWTGWAGTWLQPDWESVARQWDGVHVTVAGYLESAYRALPVDGGMTILAGWNPDETVWLGPGLGGCRPLITVALNGSGRSAP